MLGLRLLPASSPPMSTGRVKPTRPFCPRGDVDRYAGNTHNNPHFALKIIKMLSFSIVLATLVLGFSGASPIVPYPNDNSKRFNSFACNSKYQVVGGLEVTTWNHFSESNYVLDGYAADAAAKFAKDKSNPVVKTCKPTPAKLSESVKLLNANADWWSGETNFLHAFLLQVTVDVKCSKAQMKRLSKNKVAKKYINTGDGYTIPLKAYLEASYAQVQKDKSFNPILKWVNANPTFSPGKKSILKKSPPGFPSVRKTPDDTAGCKCPYGSKKKTTADCTSSTDSYNDMNGLQVVVNTTASPNGVPVICIEPTDPQFQTDCYWAQ